jgi:hypothetical protein
LKISGTSLVFHAGFSKSLSGDRILSSSLKYRHPGTGAQVHLRDLTSFKLGHFGVRLLLKFLRSPRAAHKDEDVEMKGLRVTDTRMGFHGFYSENV